MHLAEQDLFSVIKKAIKEHRRYIQNIKTKYSLFQWNSNCTWRQIDFRDTAALDTSVLRTPKTNRQSFNPWVSTRPTINGSLGFTVPGAEHNWSVSIYIKK